LILVLFGRFPVKGLGTLFHIGTVKIVDSTVREMLSLGLLGFVALNVKAERGLLVGLAVYYIDPSVRTFGHKRVMPKVDQAFFIVIDDHDAKLATDSELIRGAPPR
jgi:hypothetical protein